MLRLTLATACVLVTPLAAQQPPAGQAQPARRARRPNPAFR